MAKVLFGYDLNTPGKDYATLIAAIHKQFPAYWHCLDSTWIVETSWTPVDVRDWLKARVDTNDEIFAVDITGKAAAWSGFTGQCNDWLKNNL